MGNRVRVFPGDAADDVADRRGVEIVTRKTAGSKEDERRVTVEREGRPNERLSHASDGAQGLKSPIRPEARAETKELSVGEGGGHDAQGNGKGAAAQPPTLLLRPP